MEIRVDIPVLLAAASALGDVAQSKQSTVIPQVQVSQAPSLGCVINYAAKAWNSDHVRESAAIGELADSLVALVAIFTELDDFAANRLNGYLAGLSE